MRGWRMVWPSDHWNFAAWARWICTLPSPPAMLLGDPPNAGRDPRTALGVMTNESESRHFFFWHSTITIYILNLNGFPSLTTFSWFCHSNSRIFAIIGLLGKFPGFCGLGLRWGGRSRLVAGGGKPGMLRGSNLFCHFFLINGLL